MALSNIFREPRREITESAVGIMVFAIPAALYAWIVYIICRWIEGLSLRPDGTFGCPWGLAAIVVAPAMMVIGFAGYMALIATHALGDAACNALQRAGIHLRPRVRK